MVADVNHLLVEIGTEELPPKALRTLSESFAAELAAELDAAELAHEAPVPHATPRRLAALLPGVPATQPDREIERRGPPLARAFDENDEPTKAALGFARSIGVEVERLVRIETGGGAWLGHRSVRAGASLASLLPDMVERVLARLPAPRRMRWGDHDTEFVRPVHWVVLMHGEKVIEAEILGVPSGGATRGHRFHHPGDIVLEDAGGYASALRRDGHVVAGFEERMAMIREQVERAAEDLGGRARIDPALLEESAALVEWPVAIAGHFDTEFLELPDAVLIATMQRHQRYFPVSGDDGALMPHFITVSNIRSRSPGTVRAGNERVIRPRLSDAAYFFDTDVHAASHRAWKNSGTSSSSASSARCLTRRRECRSSPAVWRARWAHPTRRRGTPNAPACCASAISSPRWSASSRSCRARWAREYARLDGEPAPVANAIGEVYMPRFAEDAIPRTAAGRAVAIADKLDSIAGFVSVDQAPTGDKDPFALRRAALGSLRIMIEGGLALDLVEMIDAALESYLERIRKSEGASSAARNQARLSNVMRRLMLDRLRAYFADRSIPTDVFNAVLATEPTRPLDFANRVRAVEAFRILPEAASLAAANKRIRNILRQAEQASVGVPGGVDASLLREEAERSLSDTLAELEPRARTLIDAGEYTAALARLAGLRDHVDRFFDTVKVMDDDEAVRGNRLALLARIGALFMETADVSVLQPTGD